MYINKKMSLYNTVFFAFFALLFFVPTTYSVVRLVLFLLLVILALKSGILTMRVDKVALMILSFYFLNCFISGIVSIINGYYDGIERVLIVDIIWPLFYLIIINAFCFQKNYKKMIYFMIFMEFFICVFDIWYCLGNINIIPFPSFFYNIDLDMHFSKYGNFYDFTTKHMVTHMYMGPFISGLIVSRDYISEFTAGWRRIIVLTYVMNILIAMMSGRAAYQIVTSLSLISMVVFSLLRAGLRYRVKMKYVIGGITTIAVLVSLAFMFIKYLNIDVNQIVYFVQDKLGEFGTRDSIRANESDQLIAGWLDSPIFGHGSVAYVSGVIRNNAMKYSYELSYHAMLFQRGLLGSSAFVFLNAYTFIRCVKKMKNKEIGDVAVLPFVFGLFSILIINAVDPYLSKMGGLWMEFFPFYIAASKTYRIGVRQNMYTTRGYKIRTPIEDI